MSFQFNFFIQKNNSYLPNRQQYLNMKKTCDKDFFVLR